MMTAYQEKELLAKVAAGDPAAIRALFAEWHPVLASYVHRLTESRELTEEIVQDVFLKIWMTRESLLDVRHFKPYLFAVSRHQAYDALRKNLQQRERHREWEKDTSSVSVTEGDSPEQQLSSLIDQAIDQLHPRRKEVWLLSRHERLTYAEIAERLGIGTESVKTHLKLATRDIAAFLREHYPYFFLLAVPPFDLLFQSGL